MDYLANHEMDEIERNLKSVSCNQHFTGCPYRSASGFLCRAHI